MGKKMKSVHYYSNPKGCKVDLGLLFSNPEGVQMAKNCNIANREGLQSLYFIT